MRQRDKAAEAGVIIVTDYIKRDDAVWIMTETGALETQARILRLPAADVRPVVWGEWIDTGSGQQCSACGEFQPGYDNYRNFCSNCGADMRGENEADMRGENEDE